METASIRIRPDYVRWDVPVSGVEGVNERCIELPLGVEVADPASPGWVLDAGCALLPAVNAYPGQWPIHAALVHLTQDITYEPCLPKPRGRSFVSADLRNLSLFADGAFARTVCLSTLEHVGFDNQQYGGATETCPETATAALRELLRVTKRTLLLSVPFTTGPEWQNGQWRYFTQASLSRLLWPVTSQGGDAQIRYYVDSPAGWSGPTKQPILDRSACREKVHQIAVVRVGR